VSALTSGAGLAKLVARSTSTRAMQLVASSDRLVRWRSSARLSGSSMTSFTRAEEST